ncbi:MAG: hydroxymethylbilane synthase [Lachnospirales bacterium]
MKIKIGSRESKLAVEQANIVIRQLKSQYKNIEIELLTMKTTGDIILDKTLDKIGGKGLFIKELDKALIDNKTDISVHSLKDMPMDIDESLPIIAYLKREIPLDVLILPKGINYIDIKKPIGTSSKRRVFQLKKIYKEHSFKPIRGNILTRLEKLDNGEYSALVLAYAGIKRLNLEERIFKIFNNNEILPACGQGIIAIQGKKGKDYSYLDFLNDKNTEYEAKCERAFVRELNGGCSLPICAFATIKNDKIILKGFYADNNNYILKEEIGNIEDYEKIGIDLAKKFKEIIDENR